VQAFRSAHRIKESKKADDPDILTGLQARNYLGIGYHGLTTLARRGLIHTHQATDFAPYRLSRAELDSEPVQAFVAVLKATGRPPREGGCSQSQQQLFATESTATRKGAL
jgi:hypothetical protein